MASTVKRAVRWESILLAVFLLPACSRSGDTGPAATGNPPAIETPGPATPATASASGSSQQNSDLTSAFPLVEKKKDEPASGQSSVPIQIVDAAEFRAVIEKQRGKVVLVDCWATWCGPCKEQFPHTVKLRQQFGDQGLAVFSLSFDDPETQQDVAAFLETQNANFDHYMTKTGTNVVSFADFEIVGGALPFYKLYDRSGKLRYQFCGDNTDLQNVLTVEELDKRLEELLAEKA